jgi:hypothetical protein
MSERLAEIDELHKRERTEPDTLWGLVTSIHSQAVLREWVTLESEPLLPMVCPKESTQPGNQKEAEVHLLLSVRGQKDGKEVILPPWGYVRWHWPSKRLLGIRDVRDRYQKDQAELPSNCLCSREFVDGVQDALETQETLPPLPDALTRLYSEVADTLPYQQQRQESQVDSAKAQEPVDGKGCSEGEEAPVRDTASPVSATDGLSPVISGSALPSIERILRQIDGLLKEDHVDSSLMEEYRRISMRFFHPVFSVAVVGEFSRGKSTIINQLLEQDLLPIGDTPTTALLARIKYGETPTLHYVTKDGKREQMELAEASWEELAENRAGDNYEGFLVINFPNEWLRATGVHLVDSPGAGDIIDIRAALVTETIASSDAALVAVNATIPLSLTERSFIEEHVLSKGTPRVAIVLTRLDLIPEADKNSVVAFTRARLQEWAPQALLCSVQHHPDLCERELLDASGPEQIRALISSWANHEERLHLVRKQLASQLHGLVILLRESIEVRKQIFSASSDERQRAIAKAEESLNRTRMEWEDLRLALNKREMQTEEWLEHTILEAQGSIQELLAFQLDHSRNPGEWWEKDLPFLLRKEIRNVTKTLEIPLKRRFQEDSEWIVQQVRSKLTWELEAFPETPVRLDGEGHAALCPSNLSSDLSKTRSYARITAAAATAAALLMAGMPVVAIGGVLAGLAAEKFIDGKVEEQKTFLVQRLDSVVEKSLRGVMDEIRNKLRKVYEDLLNSSREEEATWFKVRLQALRQGGEELVQRKTLASVNRQAAEVTTILEELSHWTGGGH